ncbi:hypothetical protein [Bradyrhizobium sp. SZCCHNR1082]|nr:hypothetical protein [Bradyrhizobium sp. SZCCHNR1082]
MFETPPTRRRANQDEAERPFWISFSDLMSALMILFLVVMCVAMLSITRKASDITRKASDTERQAQERDNDIKGLLEQLRTSLETLKAEKKACMDATLDADRGVIDFGPQAYFDFNSHKLTPEQGKYLRECVPHILAVADSELGRRWLKRIVVEGYTDQKGGYLFNLNLSLQRSQRVLCTLLGKTPPDEPEFSPENRKRIQQLFLVGGYSFNSAKQNSDQSRRVELRLEFLGLNEKLLPPNDIATAEPEATCPLDPAVPRAQAQPLRPTVPQPPLAATSGRLTTPTPSPSPSGSFLQRLLSR